MNLRFGDGSALTPEVDAESFPGFKEVVHINREALWVGNKGPASVVRSAESVFNGPEIIAPFVTTTTKLRAKGTEVDRVGPCAARVRNFENSGFLIELNREFGAYGA